VGSEDEMVEAAAEAESLASGRENVEHGPPRLSPLPPTGRKAAVSSSSSRASRRSATSARSAATVALSSCGGVG